IMAKLGFLRHSVLNKQHTESPRIPYIYREYSSWFQVGARLATIGAEFGSHLGNVGLMLSASPLEGGPGVRLEGREKAASIPAVYGGMAFDDYRRSRDCRN
ncbi:MAG: hypothetical protein O3A85_14695, partial [Proteobacteria bacterium]|nr:hypothetical protein [Pseudomonadota bacterium]